MTTRERREYLLDKCLRTDEMREFLACELKQALANFPRNEFEAVGALAVCQYIERLRGLAVDPLEKRPITANFKGD